MTTNKTITTMKKILLTALAAVMVAGFSACNNKEKEQLRQQQLINEATAEELRAAVSDRDELLGLVNEISEGVGQIKQLENILTVNGASETPAQREQIKNDIAAIQQTLQQRRERLEELEKKLKNSAVNTANLQKTIASLREQIERQTAEIATLQENLGQARAEIGTLNTAIDSLHSTVNDVVAQRDSIDESNLALTNELNTCYFAIGNKSELSKNNIIQGGFLRKTKIMEGDFDQDFFTRADKRTLTQIDLNSNKAQVLTNQPAGSYTIDEVNGHKVLHITNPALFWSRTNYLVVKID